jgi:hypothetical protein
MPALGKASARCRTADRDGEPFSERAEDRALPLAAANGRSDLWARRTVRLPLKQIWAGCCTDTCDLPAGTEQKSEPEHLLRTHDAGRSRGVLDRYRYQSLRSAPLIYISAALRFGSTASRERRWSEVDGNHADGNRCGHGALPQIASAAAHHPPPLPRTAIATPTESLISAGRRPH